MRKIKENAPQKKLEIESLQKSVLAMNSKLEKLLADESEQETEG
jgi:hypothetical protein